MGIGPLGKLFLHPLDLLIQFAQFLDQKIASQAIGLVQRLTLQPGQSFFGPQGPGRQSHDAQRSQHRSRLVLDCNPSVHQAPSALNQPTPGPHIHAWYVHGRHRIQIQNFGQLPRIDAIIFLFALEDQTQLARMSHRHRPGHRREFLVQIAVSAGSLVAHGKRPGNFRRHAFQQLRPSPSDLQLLDGLPTTVQNAKRRSLGVNVQSDIVHRDHNKPPFGWESEKETNVSLSLSRSTEGRLAS
jgi:hypothetical protein